MKTWTALRLAASLGVAALLIAACGSRGKDGTEPLAEGKLPEASKQPVSIKFFIDPAYLNDDEVRMALTEPLRTKYPHIRLDVVRPSKDTTLETLIAANDIPDLHISWNGALNYLTDLGIVDDLEPMIRNERFDLSRFEPAAIAAMKNEAGDGHLYGIPYVMNFQLMYYNKDLFDQAGAPYPTDGMTWEEVIGLGKQVSGKLGAPYKGLLAGFNEMRFQLSLPLVDPATKQAAVASEPWKKVFETAYRALKASPESDRPASFGTDRNVAMWAAKNRNNTLKEPSEAGLQWDVVQFPGFAEKPGIGSQVDAHVVYMSPTSKHKEEAFRVIETLTSDEAQRKLSRIGKLPALNDNRIVGQFAEDVSYLRGKNWKGVFQGKFGLPPKRVMDESLVLKFALQAFDQYASGQADLNTALRTAAEQIDQVAEQKIANRQRRLVP
ncbi:ABC transporter substrate-binding protein [Paenibacillus sp. GYB003]|uniref:ABC transporter substrate-binding protein n=1 Tax=Paenibacillus sp. GYB003 TaxID=2994392 RepID=UPI002F96ADBB